MDEIEFWTSFLDIKFHINTKISSQVFNKAFLAPALVALYMSNMAVDCFEKTEGRFSGVLFGANSVQQLTSAPQDLTLEI